MEQESLGSASSAKFVKKKTPGRPRSKAIDTPNSEEQCEAVTDETLIEDDTEVVEKVEDVGVVGAGSVEGEKEGGQGVGSVGLSDETEGKSMEVNEPVVEKVCELVEKGNDVMEVEVAASQDASVSFKRLGRPIVDLNISADNEDCTGEKEGEKGKEELKDQEGDQGKEELKEQEGEKGKEELRELDAEKAKEELKELDGEKGKEELKELDGEKGKEELTELEGQKGKEELTELEGQKGKGELTELEGQKGKVELKEQEGDKGKEKLKVQELEKAKGEETYLSGHKENTKSFGVEVKAQMQKEDANPIKDDGEGLQSCEKYDLGEQGKVELVEEDPEEPPEETLALEEEHRELEAIANQRKIKKEHEIFVGGLDRDATEEDLRKVFQRIGEIVEVRLHKNSSTNKNKGYAFVKFANKENAKKALSEMKNPVVCFSI